jgi:hypothetical protein
MSLSGLRCCGLDVACPPGRSASTPEGRAESDRRPDEKAEVLDLHKRFILVVQSTIQELIG